MARHAYEDGTVYYVCDHCGCKLMDDELPNTGMAITIRKGKEIQYEWWNKGDYCYECSDALFNAVYRTLPVPERYDAQFRDDMIAKAIEGALIRRELGIEVE